MTNQCIRQKWFSPKVLGIIFLFHSSAPPPYQVPRTSHSYSSTLPLPGFTFNAFHFQNNNGFMARFQFPARIKSVSEQAVSLAVYSYRQEAQKGAPGWGGGHTQGEQHVILSILTVNTLKISWNWAEMKKAFLILLQHIFTLCLYSRYQGNCPIMQGCVLKWK